MYFFGLQPRDEATMLVVNTIEFFLEEFTWKWSLVPPPPQVLRDVTCNGDGKGNEDFKKAIGLLSKSSTLQSQHTFLHIIFVVLFTNTTWKSLTGRFTEDVNKDDEFRSFSL